MTRLNGGVTVIGQLAAVTSKTTNLAFTFLHGPEKPHNMHDQRSLYELIGAWKVMPRFTLGFDGLYADEDHAATNGSDAIWKGLAGYSKYNFTKEFRLRFAAKFSPISAAAAPARRKPSADSHSPPNTTCPPSFRV